MEYVLLHLKTCWDETKIVYDTFVDLLKPFYKIHNSTGFIELPTVHLQSNVYRLFHIPVVAKVPNSALSLSFLFFFFLFC